MACEHLIKRRIININDLKQLSTPYLIHVGKEENQKAAYAKNSFFIGIDELKACSQTTGGSCPLPDMNEFAKKMMKAGLNPGTLVVIYSPVDIVFSARLWWMLKTLGIIGYVINDGEEMRSYEYNPPSFLNYETLVFDPSQLVEYEEIKENLNNPDYYLIDSRDEESYNGNGDSENKSGHIPGAHHHYYKNLIKNGVPDFPDINEEFPLADEKNIILYCGSGISACVNALLLESISIPYRVYIGSISDWTSREDSWCECK